MRNYPFQRLHISKHPAKQFATVIVLSLSHVCLYFIDALSLFENVVLLPLFWHTTSASEQRLPKVDCCVALC